MAMHLVTQCADSATIKEPAEIFLQIHIGHYASPNQIQITCRSHGPYRSRDLTKVLPDSGLRYYW